MFGHASSHPWFAKMKRKILTEFVQQRDMAGPFCNCDQSAEERERADREYFDRVRAEVGLVQAAGSRPAR
jgi:hypothetical protein